MADPRSRHARRPGGTRGRARPATRGAADPRRVAWEVVQGVSQDDAYANLLLAARLRERHLQGRDAAFTTELVAGTLRRQGTYDAVLGACLDRPLRRLDPPVLTVLRLGCHQLLGMRVSTHAAVSTSVELVRSVVGPRPAGLVNAVLRRVAAHDLPSWVRLVAPDPVSDPRGFAAVAHAHPRWVVDALADALAAVPEHAGEEELGDLLRTDNDPPAVTLVARPGQVEREELLGPDRTPTPYSPWGVVLASGDPGAVPAVADGRAGVQDEGSQLMVLALSRAGLQGRDDRWLDLCAGPGGKAALLGALAASGGAHLLAVERQPHRAGLVRRATAALPAGTVDVVIGDGTQPAWRPGTFDRVLVDAPCTGLGALRRRPESRWRRTPDDLAALVPLQRRLLATALTSVRPGGVVAYVTCSPVLDETAGVVRAAVDDGAVLEDATALLREVPDCPGPVPGTVQLWPHRHGTDAMFLALFRRPA